MIAYNWDKAKKQVNDWKLSGCRIVFTNGCFDILHRGHVEYLIEAKACGDKLVIALNSDSSVRSLKGDTRPIQNQEDRAVILDSLESVDLVVVFVVGFVWRYDYSLCFSDSVYEFFGILSYIYL